MDAIDRIERALHDIRVLKSRNAKPLHHEPKESISERDFVRKFGTKVKKVRWSGRGDMVGLLVVGNTSGFWITRNAASGKRYVNIIDVLDNKLMPTERKFVLKSSASLHYMWRGLLNFVR